VTNVTYTPSSEAVDEFRVEQSNFSAEYGFSGASVVNMIHAFRVEYLSWRSLRFRPQHITDANNWFNNLNGVPIPPYTAKTRRHRQRTDLEEQDILLLRL